MFELHRHNPKRRYDPTGYTDLISRHHTAKGAGEALDAAQQADPSGPRYFVTKPTTLLTGTGRLTNAYWLIEWAKSRFGVTVTKRQKGFSDYPQLTELVAEGLLEVRNKGPRGGQTWHATRKGRRAVAKVDDVKFGQI